LSADDAWLAWLGNVIGVAQSDRSLAQWRVAMIPRPDPGGAFAYVTDPVTGEIDREPLMLYPYSAGSKGGIKQAVQDLYAQSLAPVTLIEGSTVINAGYADRQAVARLLGAAWTSPDSSALVVSTATGFDFHAEADGTVTVAADQTDAPTVTAFDAGGAYAFRMTLTTPTETAATVTFTLTGTSATMSESVEVTVDSQGTPVEVTVVAPEGVVEANVTVVVDGATAGQVISATRIATLDPIFDISKVNANLHGLGIPADTKIVAVLGAVSAEMSRPAEFTVAAGLVVVVPSLPVLVNDHWLGDPWTVNVAVPFGTDPAALANTLAAQQPAGVTFTVTFGVLTWQTLYDTYGDGIEATWLSMYGGNAATPPTWQDLERQIIP
jgi:hypothetical protein